MALDKVSVQRDEIGSDGALVLLASKDAGPGEALLTVPDKAWLNIEAVKGSALAPLVGEMDAWLQLALWLVGERFGAGGRGGSSHWSAYVDSLPGSLDSPVLWSLQQLELIQGSQLSQLTTSYQ